MDLIRILQVVFGIGLVIFVHEGGHFIAARLCKVRVDVFSLGFGPRLLGWRRGATLYQVAAIPIGGYVKMAGELPDGSGRPPRGDELHSKSVGQRFFIYSGGVLMNVVFALVAFPLVLSAGVPLYAPVIGAPLKGMPAWRAGLVEGTEILAIEGEPTFDFSHIHTAVALADPGPLQVSVRRPGATGSEVVLIEPEKNDDFAIFMIGVGVGYDPTLRLRVAAEGAAHAAGLREGDVLLGVEGALAAHSPTEQLRRALATGQALRLRVRRGEEELTAEVAPAEVDVKARKFGFSPLQNRVGALRPNPDLAALGLGVGERVIAVDGRPIVRPSDWLDALLAAEGAPRVRLRAVDGSQREATFPRPLDPAAAAQADRDLHLGYADGSTLIEVSPGQAAALAGLRDGDRLRALNGEEVTSWSEVLKRAKQLTRGRDPVQLTYERRDEQGVWRGAELEVTPALMTAKDYGFDLDRARRIYRADSIGESIDQGFAASWRFLADAWLTVKKMATGRVGTENLGGIITISTVSYSWASEGWAKLFFFLCILSLNLAFLNVLPIPVLDGGHLLFCVVEAVKGSPVSERTLGYSQVVGLVVILTLMVYVTYQDVLRILPG